MAGIITAAALPHSSVMLCGGASVLSFCLLLGLCLRANYSRDIVIGCVATLFLFMTGATRALLWNSSCRTPDSDIHIATLLERPVKKTESYRAEALLHDSSEKGSASRREEKILIYFAGEASVDHLQPGSLVVFAKEPAEVVNRGNPYEFDYQKYLERQSISRQVFLLGGQWREPGNDSTFRIRILAEKVRNRLLDVYTQNGLEGIAFDILSALTLGYKKTLDQEIKQVFATTGASHVLAVSGLHVGIIYLIFNFFFGFLKRMKAGRPMFLLLALFLLWGYAFLTGLSPSVCRSSLMFSVVLAGDNLRRPANIYNTLALSAFFLLLYRPVLLYDVGFQLSYLAVLGIVTFQPVISGIWEPGMKVLSYVWGLFSVSVSAQLLTFSVSCLYFSQFPVYFWLSNFVVIPGAFLLIIMAVMVLITSPFTLISHFLAKMSILAVEGIYWVLCQIGSLPGALLSGFNFSGLDLAFSFSILLCLPAFIKWKKPVWLFMLMLATIIYLSAGAAEKVRRSKRNAIIVYNVREPLVHLIWGTANYIVAPAGFLKNESYESVTAPVITKLGLASPVLIPLESDYEDEWIVKKSGAIHFDGKIIVLTEAEGGRSVFGGTDIIITCRDSLSDDDIPPGVMFISYGFDAENREGPSNVHYVRKMGAWSQGLR